MHYTVLYYPKYPLTPEVFVLWGVQRKLQSGPWVRNEIVNTCIRLVNPYTIYMGEPCLNIAGKQQYRECVVSVSLMNMTEGFINLCCVGDVNSLLKGRTHFLSMRTVNV